MKFGYRDRIILLIVCIVVIFAVGIFVFIKPKWEDLNNHQDSLKTAQEDWDKKRKNYDQITTRQGVIQRKYDESVVLAEGFSPEMSSVELDEFLRKEFLNTEKHQKDEVEVRGAYSVSDEATASLSYYYYTPNVITYPLLESADLDGSLADAAKEKRKTTDFLSSRSSQAVGSGRSTFTLRINREDTMALLDAVNAYAESHKDAMMINSVTLAKCDFNEDLETDKKGNANQQLEQGDDQTGLPPQNNNNNAAATEDGVKAGYTDVTIEYTVYYIQEPTQPYIGDPYDAAIWNGEEWRTKVAK
jgi:hypothetical protein